jgi:AraC-like DNA-binding protein
VITIKEKALTQLKYSDFDLKDITVDRVCYPDFSKVNYLEKGRTQNLLHFLISGSREYEINNQKFIVEEGSVIFIPDKTAYRTNVVGDNMTDYKGISICFDMVQPTGKIQIVHDVYYEWEVNLSKMADYFYRMEEMFKNSSVSVLKLKITLFQMLYNLCGADTNISRNNDIIKPALSFIAEHYTENLPVSVYAEKCRISESYFRKKFLESTGMSPLDYRNELRLNEARQMYQKNYNLQEIAEKVGFNDAGYLSKVYKRHTGSSLKRDAKYI